RLFAADANIAMQSHVHARAHCGTVDHGDRWFANNTDVPVQLSEAVIEMLAHRVGPFVASARALDVGTNLRLSWAALQVGARAEAAADTGQDDHADVRIVIRSTHVLADLSDRAEHLGGAIERIHHLRTIELDPENAGILLLVEKIVDELRSHVGPPDRLG